MFFLGLSDVPRPVEQWLILGATGTDTYRLPMISPQNRVRFAEDSSQFGRPMKTKISLPLNFWVAFSAAYVVKNLEGMHKYAVTNITSPTEEHVHAADHKLTGWTLHGNRCYLRSASVVDGVHQDVPHLVQSKDHNIIIKSFLFVEPWHGPDAPHGGRPITGDGCIPGIRREGFTPLTVIDMRRSQQT